ncbi:MAG: MoxR family ATPase [Burkholderiaceae bacterium]|nr:MoxR family ATPase [Burkholderiaceae bacterium]
MDYDPKYFDLGKLGGTRVPKTANLAWRWREGGKPQVYVFTPSVQLAVNVALATRRPLLVAGEPGSGKTLLARAVASALGWPYYRHTVTSRSQATDLLWSFDALRRLNHATTPGETLQPMPHYVEPGAVWWGFDPETAAQRGLEPIDPASARARDPAAAAGGDSAVVLVDEIDKADPDVPNDLLEPFDTREFTVRETNERIVARRDVLLVLTTNTERELPPAFLRRCVTLALDEPDAAWFEQLAARHFPKGDRTRHQQLAAAVMRLRGQAPALQRRKPSTAEFLDAVRVCEQLGIDQTSPHWPDVVGSVLLKSDRPRAPGAGDGRA